MLRAALQGGVRGSHGPSDLHLLLLQQQGLSSASSGLPSLSGVCSVPGVACPVYASPSPHTPHACLYPNPEVSLPTSPQEEGRIDFKREKSALPKLNIKGGDATSITRTIHEWLQRTSIALNTWSASAVHLWHNAVALAKAAQPMDLDGSFTKGFTNRFTINRTCFTCSTVSP